MIQRAWQGLHGWRKEMKTQREEKCVGRGEGARVTGRGKNRVGRAVRWGGIRHWWGNWKAKVSHTCYLWLFIKETEPELRHGEGGRQLMPAGRMAEIGIYFMRSCIKNSPHLITCQGANLTWKDNFRFTAVVPNLDRYPNPCITPVWQATFF